MNKMQFRRVLFASGAILAAASAAHAAETDNPSNVEEVVVRAERQQYRGDVPLKELPQNVAVIEAQVLEAVGVTRLDAALDLVSGVERQNNFGGLWDSFAVRGFTGDPNVPSGYLVNGFNAGRGFGGPRDASSIERLEVLKGPGSALFGRGEPGGTVNIITKKPKFTPEGSLAFMVGSYDRYRLEADATGPITGVLAFRINGAYEQADSFRDFLSSEKLVVTPSLVAQIGERTTITYEGEGVRQDVPFDRGVVSVNNQLGVIPTSRFLGEANDGDIRLEVLGHQLQFSHELTDNWTLLLGAAYRDTLLKGYSTDAELLASRQLIFRDGRTLSRQRRYRNFETEHTVVRGELSGNFETGPFKHHIIAGADAERFILDQVQLRFRPPLVTSNPTPAQANAIDIFNPVYGRTPPPLGPFQDSYEKQRAWGAYAQDQIDITESLKLRVGVRYDEFRQRIDNQITNRQTRANITNWSPQVGVMYVLNDHLSVYAAYAKGFRPNSGFDVTGTAFEPEKSKSSEIGAKFDLMEGALTGTVALYKMEKSNIITSDPINSGFAIAVGKAESKGVELDVEARLPAGIRARLAYAYTDAETAVPLLEPDFGQPVPAGAPLLGIPKHSGDLLVFRDFELAGERTLTVGGSVQYIDKRLGQTATTFKLPSYTLVHLFASYEFNEHIRLAANVNNLFDKDYYPASFARLWVQPGAPRTFSVRLAYTF